MKKADLLQRIFLVPFLATILAGVLPATRAPAAETDLLVAQGIDRLQEGDPSGSLTLLGKALTLAPDNPEAIFYSGIAHVRLGNHGEGETFLKRALNAQETAEEAHLELGRLYYLQIRCDLAREHLERFASLTADADLGAAARELARDCGREETERPWWISLVLGEQYDSNVMLEPSNPAPGGEGPEDWRSLAYLSAGAVFPLGARAGARVDYSFYGSWHADLDDFNILSHRVAPALRMNLTSSSSAEAGCTLEYSRFGGGGYSRYLTTHAEFALQEGANLSSRIRAEYRDATYWDTPVFQTNSGRTGFSRSLGVSQRAAVDRFEGQVSYTYAAERAREEHWSSDGHRLDLEAGWQISSDWSAGAAARFGWDRYREVFPGGGAKRHDDTQEYSVHLQYRISRAFGVMSELVHTRNASNLDLFDYRRTIAGAFLTIQY
jgi:tetratricopeptide (TPR) repeat protein